VYTIAVDMKRPWRCLFNARAVTSVTRVGQ
jgi:hypothetical protein